MQTDDSDTNSAVKTTPFDQIKELERRENARVDTEISAMQKEKEEVSQAVQKKELEAQEAMKAEAKKELKEYSEKELSSILSQAQKDAEKEATDIESSYNGKKDAVIKNLLEKAIDPDSLFTAA